MKSKKQRSGNTSLKVVNTDIPFFNICVLSFSNKKYIITRAGQQFFNASSKRVTSSMQKRKHHQIIQLLPAFGRRFAIKLSSLSEQAMIGLYPAIQYFVITYQVYWFFFVDEYVKFWNYGIAISWCLQETVLQYFM